nr:class I SAM-dependent methyltransferase [Anaerolineae bacterium]
MTISLPDIEFLSSELGTRLLTRLASTDLSESATLPLITTLRKDYSADQTRAALEIARLRLKAADKFGADASLMFFTRDALEQASDPLVRRYRASQVGAVRVVDACCGIGADSLALASIGAEVIGLDLDAVRIEIARHNAAALGLNARFQLADVRTDLPAAGVAFFDPGRRDEQGNRIHNVEHYFPPLSTIKAWPHQQVIVKLSPGVDLSQLASYEG